MSTRYSPPTETEFVRRSIGERYGEWIRWALPILFIAAFTYFRTGLVTAAELDKFASSRETSVTKLETKLETLIAVVHDLTKIVVVIQRQQDINTKAIADEVAIRRQSDEVAIRRQLERP